MRFLNACTAAIMLLGLVGCGLFEPSPERQSLFVEGRYSVADDIVITGDPTGGTGPKVRDLEVIRTLDPWVGDVDFNRVSGTYRLEFPDGWASGACVPGRWIISLRWMRAQDTVWTAMSQPLFVDEPAVCEGTVAGAELIIPPPPSSPPAMP